MSESLASILKSATEKLSSSDSARLDAEILLLHVLGKDRSYLYAHGEMILEPAKFETFNHFIQKRSEGIPVAYLTGFKEFWSLPLQVTNDTLIPRPETELLIETVLKYADKDCKFNILDLGTGTGAIAIALAKELPKTFVIATDISDKTLHVAKRNAQTHHITNVDFVISDWFSNINTQAFDFIISNPPYISESDPHLEQGDVRFEPARALASGQDGLNDLKIIIAQAKDHLTNQGYLLVEHGYQQGNEVESLLQQNGYHTIQALYDLADHHRATMARKT